MAIYSRVLLIIVFACASFVALHLFQLSLRAYSQVPPLSRVLPTLSLPIEYQIKSDEGEWCESRYGSQYLYNLRDRRYSYCQPGSKSSIDCFQSNVAPGRVDSFCFISNVAMKSNDDLLGVDCRFEDSDIHTEEQPKFPGNEFPSYMYDTGPRYIFESYMKFANDTDLQCPPRAITPNYTVLIKREGAYNLWHSLMEIFSMYMTMDVLQIAVNNATGGAYFSPSNKANTQILLLDGHDQGPYFGLWSLFTDKPPLRLADLARSERSECLDNVIVPLPGGSNPMWQGDWEAKECEQSILLDTFSRRILNHYHIQEEREPSERLTFTFIDRQQTRKLLHQDRLLLLLKYRYPSIIIQAIDFAALSFPEQIRVIQNTDILAGVHGAGLTHAMFLPPDSSVVEILPAVLLHKGFRNLAKLRGHRYFSDHALTGPDTEDGYRLSEDWQGTDVELDEESFMGLMDVAIQSMLHRGTLASDVS